MISIIYLFISCFIFLFLSQVNAEGLSFILESKRYPGFFLDAYGAKGANPGSHAYIRLVKHKADGNWGWFKIYIQDGNHFILLDKEITSLKKENLEMKNRIRALEEIIGVTN